MDFLLGTGQPSEADHVIEEIKKQFDFGSWADDREDEVLEYGGKENTDLTGPRCCPVPSSYGQPK